MNRRASIVLVAGLCVAATSEITLAVKATNVTTNEVVFDSAGFEADTVGTPPSAAAIGTWQPYYVDQVITGGAPGAFEGANYVRTIRDANGAGGPEARFAANQDFAGDRVHIEWMMWNASGNDTALILHNPNTYYRGLGRITGGTYLNYNGAAYINSGLAYLSNVWQRWEIDYVIGAANYTVTVGGNSVSVPTLDGIGTLGGGSLDGLYFGHNGFNTYYIDAVPEPASLLLIAVGGLLLRRRTVSTR